MTLPPDRFCNLVYVWLANRQESEADLAELDRRLEEPFPWEEKKALTPADWETDDNSFMEAMSSLGIG